MTLSELLEELKGIDPETADDIGDIANVISILSDGSFSSDAYYPDFIIQGCLQRACERREWGFIICNQVANVCTKTSTYASEIYDTPAEALLAAYIAAVRAEEMR